MRTIRDAGLDVRSMDEDAVYAAGSHLMDYRAEGRVSRGQPVGGGPQEADSTCRGR